MVGPTCPVQSAEMPQCNGKPYQATLLVLDQKDQVVAQVESNAEGFFVVSLAAGEYVLQPVSTSVYPRGAPLSVSVPQGQVVQITYTFDSGIR